MVLGTPQSIAAFLTDWPPITALIAKSRSSLVYKGFMIKTSDLLSFKVIESKLVKELCVEIVV